VKEFNCSLFEGTSKTERKKQKKGREEKRKKKKKEYYRAEKELIAFRRW